MTVASAATPRATPTIAKAVPTEMKAPFFEFMYRSDSWSGYPIGVVVVAHGPRPKPWSPALLRIYCGVTPIRQPAGRTRSHRGAKTIVRFRSLAARPAGGQ